MAGYPLLVIMKSKFMSDNIFILVLQVKLLIFLVKLASTKQASRT